MGKLTISETKELTMLRIKDKYELIVKGNKAGNVYLKAKNGLNFNCNLERQALDALFSNKELQDTIRYLVSKIVQAK